ncbi:MAG: Ig-like domain-containing protein, partial [Paludibacteraceae bacterium]|nr:Ig-like domain-containing protein [Paludibacteraceae bacterium]
MKKSTLFLLCALVALVFASCKKEDPLSALELKFSQPSVTIDEGGDYNLGKLLLITPQNVADTLTVNWKSADPSIAQMVSKKWVLGVSMGETTITAESHGKSASIKVIVNELPITGLTIKNKYSGSVNVPIALDG